MHRFVTPLLFAAMTAYLWHYNTTHVDRQLLLPFIDLVFPAEARNMAYLGQRSIEGGVIFTAVSLLWAIVGSVRAGFRRPEPAD